MIPTPEASAFIDQASALYVPGDEAYAREQGFKAFPSEGITRGRSNLTLPSSLIYDGATPVTVESSLSRSALAENRTFATAHELGRNLLALQFTLSIGVAYPIRYDDHMAEMQMRREITVSKDNGTIRDCFVADIPTCDSRLQRAADPENTATFMGRLIASRFSPDTLASGLTNPNVWPAIGSDEAEALAVGPVFPGEGPSRYENARREALSIARRVAQSGYTLLPR